MYTLVRRFIKTGIIFLALGLVLGVYMLVRREIRGAWPHPYLVSAHTHAMLAGFVLYCPTISQPARIVIVRAPARATHPAVTPVGRSIRGWEDFLILNRYQ